MAWRSWACATVIVLVICFMQVSLLAQRSSARYVGGTLVPGPRLVQYKCKSRTGTLDLASDADLVFGADKNVSVTIPYDSISSLQYGLETVRGAFCYPWDSYQQFTKKRHYLLTVGFHDPATGEHAVVFELEKGTVRPILARLEARSGKTVEFTNAVACTEYKSPEECGHGQRSELKGLTRVFIESSAADRDRITAEISRAQLGLTVVENAREAEILLKYTAALVAETGSAFGMMGGMPTEAGRGEISVVRAGRLRVIMMFEDIRTSKLEKDPATNFGKTFVEAYRAAAAGSS